MRCTNITFYTLPILFLLASSCNNQQAKHQPADMQQQTADTLMTERTACLLSEIAYCTDINTALTTYMTGWKKVWEANELGGNHAFVAVNGTTYALAIRGSLINFSWSAFQNWIYQDLNVTSQEKWSYTTDSSAARIAAGAYSGWQNLDQMTGKISGETLRSFLIKTLTNESNLLITGHSLGGNLATVYGSYLWQVLKEKKISPQHFNVITFAAPAAGNVFFANDFNTKFPNAIRVENVNDIVPKFPSTTGIKTLADLFSDSLSSAKIMVGYKSFTVSLSKVFVLISTALDLLEITNNVSPYIQPCGKGKILSIPLSGKNNGTDIINWLNEAGYQHGIARYAIQEGVPVLECAQ